MSKSTNEEKPLSPPKGSHLTLVHRVRIEVLLGEGQSLRYIASDLGKNPSTISREVKRNRVHYGAKANDCTNKRYCDFHNMCGDKTCEKACRSCIKCKNFCSHYKQFKCEVLETPPHVCNHCIKRGGCQLERYFYRGEDAHRRYLKNLVNTRNGYNLSDEDLDTIDNLVTPLIKHGLSPYHIKQTLGDSLPISESTLRRMIADKVLTVRNIDLHNQVKRKPRRKNHQLHNEAPVSKEGHTYQDYLAYISENETSVVQMDCVEGIKEDKAVLLTLHFLSQHMQLAFWMPSQTSASVVHVLDMLETTLGTELFSELFPVILTDNGTEFSNIKGMERSIYDGSRTKIYFCEPNRSDQKSECESNHRLIRYVIPKGTSLGQYRQPDITLMMNHINSYKRKPLYGNAPYQIAMQLLPSKFFDALGLVLIPPEEVILKPSLLKK